MRTEKELMSLWARYDHENDREFCFLCTKPSTEYLVIHWTKVCVCKECEGTIWDKLLELKVEIRGTKRW
jgi:hypothetical protein